MILCDYFPQKSASFGRLYLRMLNLDDKYLLLGHVPDMIQLLEGNSKASQVVFCGANAMGVFMLNVSELICTSPS